jgi:hypothetical protein
MRYNERFERRWKKIKKNSIVKVVGFWCICVLDVLNIKRSLLIK